MNPLVLVLPVLTGLAAFLFSRPASASSSTPGEGGASPELGDGEPDEASRDTLPPSTPSSPSSPSPSSPRPPIVPGSQDTGTPAPPKPPKPSKRSPKDAAQALYDYVVAAINAGRARSLGSKGAPNAIVADAERDMGVVPDNGVYGIYGPKVRARGKELLGKTFPARPSEPAKPTKPDAQPQKPKPPASSSTPLKSDPVVLQEADRVRLERGASYRATIVLSGMETLASNEQVAERLQSLVGPWKPLSVTGSGGVRRATGTYAGNTRTVERPGNVTEFERVAAPQKPAQPAPAPPRPAPSPAPAPRPPIVPGSQNTGTPAPSPPSPVRSPVAAAQALYDYASAAIKAGRGSSLGTKGKPNAVVADAERDMGIVPDNGVYGIYGPKIRARGKELLGKTFPART